MVDEPVSRVITPAELRAGFVRQRRSLIATSAVLTLFMSAGVTLNDLSILGNTFNIARPNLVPGALWLLWAYFGLRYYQHFSDLRDPGPLNAFKARISNRMIRRAETEMEARLRAQYAVDGKAYSAVIRYNEKPSWGEPAGKWYVVLNGSVMDGEVNGVSHQTGFADQQFTYEPSFWDRLIARSWVALNTRYFSEYSLPVVVALVPVLVSFAAA